MSFATAQFFLIAALCAVVFVPHQNAFGLEVYLSIDEISVVPARITQGYNEPVKVSASIISVYGVKSASAQLKQKNARTIIKTIPLKPISGDETYQGQFSPKKLSIGTYDVVIIASTNAAGANPKSSQPVEFKVIGRKSGMEPAKTGTAVGAKTKGKIADAAKKKVMKGKKSTPALPDLSAGEAVFNAAADRHVQWKEFNTGTVQAGVHNTRFQWLDADGNDVGPRSGTFWNGNTLAAGANNPYIMTTSHPLSSYFTAPPAGATKLKIIADSEGTVTEGSESNNSLIVNRPLPDLSAGEAVFNAAADRHVQWKEFNTGTVQAGVHNTRFQWLDADGNDVGPRSGTFWNGNTLAAGANNPYIMTTSHPLSSYFTAPPAGATKLKIIADSEGTVTEGSESNNSLIVNRP